MFHLMKSLENEVKRTVRKFVDGYNLRATFEFSEKADFYKRI